MKKILSVFIAMLLLCSVVMLPVSAQADSIASVNSSATPDEATPDEATPDALALTVSADHDEEITFAWNEVPEVEYYILNIFCENHEPVEEKVTENTYAWNPYIEGEGFVAGVTAYNEEGTVVMQSAELTFNISIGGIWDRPYVIGDANLDREVNIKDATLIQKGIAELVELSEYQLLSADADEDAEVTIKDATEIQKYCAEILPEDTSVGTEIWSSGVFYSVEIQL